MSPAPGNGSWDGLERRRSTPAERKRYEQRERSSDKVLVDVVASPWKVVLGQLAELPKPLLVLVSLVAVIMLARAEAKWRSDMDAHVGKSQDGYQRISILEEKARVTSDRLDKLTDTVEMQTRHQLDFYRWTADRAGDERKALEYEAKLKALGSKP